MGITAAAVEGGGDNDGDIRGAETMAVTEGTAVTMVGGKDNSGDNRGNSSSRREQERRRAATVVIRLHKHLDNN